MNSQTNAVEQTPLSARATRRAGAAAFELLVKLRAVLALVLLVFIFSLATSSFLTTNNLTILAKHVSINAFLAIGMTFVVLAGGIDLSVGSVVGLAGMVAGWLITRGVTWPGSLHPYYPSVGVVILGALAVSGAVGLLNGLLVTRLSIAPFIATLGTLYVARGAGLLLSGGRTFPNLGGETSRHNVGFPEIGQSFLMAVPVPVWLLLVLVVAAAVVASKTPFGRHVYAIGGNERASLLSGIRVDRVKLLTYIISSLCAGIVGLMIAAQLEAAHPATGESFELTAIAAVVLGGTSLMGGRGSVWGSLIGAFVIGVLADGLVMLGTSEFWQMVIKGIVIIAAVAIDQLQASAHLRVARSR